MIAGLFLLLGTSAFAPAAGSDCARIEVHDGDTFRCDGVRMRILSIEAPEVEGSPRCRRPTARDWCDYRLGELSGAALERFLRSGLVKLEQHGQDHYRRPLVHVEVNGQDAGQHLISLGLAREYR